MQRTRHYYGWTVLAVAAAAMVGTLPGRTQGLGIVTEPLIADLGIGRVTYATVNFWATIVGAAGAIGIGRALDRFGSRSVLTVLAVVLGVVVCGMSQVTGLVGLVLALTLTRALGQSALSVVSLAMVGNWFVKRIDIAMAFFSLATSIGFMTAFPTVGVVVQTFGWRVAWLGIGVALIVVLAPLAWVIVRRNPESCGLAVDGFAESAVIAPESMLAAGGLTGHRWGEALATPAFWVFAVGGSLYNLVASGVGLFNESILAERGFGPEVYYQTLVVTALAALVGNFGGGLVARRASLSLMLSASMAVLAVGVGVLPMVTRMWQVMAWAVAMGVGGGVVMVLFFTVWPRVFGRRDLGMIQGIAQTLTVLASALGPLLLAWCVDWTGSYAAMFRILAAVVAMVAAAGLLVSLPAPQPLASPVPASPR